MRASLNLVSIAFRNNSGNFNQFVRKVGITRKQWKKYVQTGKIKVSPLTIKKMEVIAEGSPYKDALIKMLDARK